MFIKKLQLKNFKRFSDLTIDLEASEETPKLVLLIGANGSGKSCVFDAFEFLQAPECQAPGIVGTAGDAILTFPNLNLYLKKTQVPFVSSVVCIDGDKGKFSFEENKSVTLKGIKTEDEILDWKKKNLRINPYKFYGRTAFRNISYLETERHAGEYSERSISKVVEKNLDRTSKSIDKDERWETDIVYACTDNIQREILIHSLNQNFGNIFKLKI
jgi:AAA15 family ATPase/GTPase